MTIPLSMVFRHSTDVALVLALVPMDCAERLRDGTAEDGDWDTVAARLSIGTVLARWFYHDEREVLAEAVDMIAAYKTLTPNQHRVIDNALRVTNAMEAKTTRRDLKKAIEYTLKAASRP